jgi:hypothetical protein
MCINEKDEANDPHLNSKGAYQGGRVPPCSPSRKRTPCCLLKRYIYTMWIRKFLGLPFSLARYCLNKQAHLVVLVGKRKRPKPSESNGTIFNR